MLTLNASVEVKFCISVQLQGKKNVMLGTSSYKNSQKLQLANYYYSASVIKNHMHDHRVTCCVKTFNSSDLGLAFLQEHFPVSRRTSGLHALGRTNGRSVKLLFG